MQSAHSSFVFLSFGLRNTVRSLPLFGPSLLSPPAVPEVASRYSPGVDIAPYTSHADSPLQKVRLAQAIAFGLPFPSLLPGVSRTSTARRRAALGIPPIGTGVPF